MTGYNWILVQLINNENGLTWIYEAEENSSVRKFSHYEMRNDVWCVIDQVVDYSK